MPPVYPQQNCTRTEKLSRFGAKRRFWAQTVLTTRAQTSGTAGALGSVLQLPLATGEGWAGPGAAGHLPVGTGAPHTSRAGPLRAVLHTTQPRAKWELEISLVPFQVPPLSSMRLGTDKKRFSDHVAAGLGCEMQLRYEYIHIFFVGMPVQRTGSKRAKRQKLQQENSTGKCRNSKEEM